MVQTDWSTWVPTPQRGEPMPNTREYWEKHWLMQDELIRDLLAENRKLKQKINKLEQKNGRSG